MKQTMDGEYKPWGIDESDYEGYIADLLDRIHELEQLLLVETPLENRREEALKIVTRYTEEYKKLEEEVEEQKKMRLNALRRIEELEPKLNDELHDTKVENAKLRKALGEVLEICSGGEMPSWYVGKCEEIARKALEG